jgi:hypothetical protein
MMDGDDEIVSVATRQREDYGPKAEKIPKSAYLKE